MDVLEAAALHRARAAINVALDGAGDVEARAKAFKSLAFDTLRAGLPEDVQGLLESNPDPLVRKAASAHALHDDIWSSGDARALAAGYLASIAEYSLLDSLKLYGRVLPVGDGFSGRVLLAAGQTGDIVSEGDLKIVKNLSLTTADAVPLKSVAVVAATKEMLQSGGEAARLLFEMELRQAVVRSTNAAAIAVLTDTNSASVTGTTDALANLRLGLNAAPASHAYVVAAGPGAVAALSTYSENKGGMTPMGGLFSPGLSVVGVEGISSMYVFPASRIAIYDLGLEVRSGGHATINMADDPDSPSTAVSMFQTNSVALLCERSWAVTGDPADTVIVSPAES